MRLVSTADLKNHTNEVLRTALAGEPVVVTRHGRPVASLLRLDEDGLSQLASTAAAAPQTRVGRGRDRRHGDIAIGPFEYASFPLSIGAFYVAYGPDGPAFATIASSPASFERDAARYLGGRVRPGSAPLWLSNAVEAAFAKHEVFRGQVDLTRVGPFEREVLGVLRRIPAGAVKTYGEVAKTLGQPGAARAVGAACARNPLPLLIPCHRVVRSDGGLGGFSLRGGVALKRRLLEAEGALPTLLS
jgi:methylated-DNA-[protein]-cysteine S-methyltransferase